MRPGRPCDFSDMPDRYCPSQHDQMSTGFDRVPFAALPSGTHNETLLAHHLDMNHALPRSIQFRQQHTLKLPQHRLSVDNRGEHAMTEKNAPQMRGRVLSLAIGEFRAVVLVVQTVFDHPGEKGQHVVKQSVLALGDKQSGRRVLGVDRNQSIADT